MIGLFVTALVGLYTIEDLWEKFGDLKMPVVSRSHSAFLRQSKCLPARSSTALGRKNMLPDYSAHPRLYGILQNPLYGTEPLWTW